MADQGERLLDILGQHQAATARKRNGRTLPKGTEPAFEWDPKSQTGTVAGNFPAGEARDWTDVLEFLGRDPELYEVDENQLVQVRAWDAAIGGGETKRMQYAKATIRLRSNSSADADELITAIQKAKPPRLKAANSLVGTTDIMALSDWQIGKAMEDGGGTPETIERVVDSIGKMQDRFRDQAKLKKAAYRLILPGMGDLTERCAGHYPSQTYTTDLNEREQARVARWLLHKVVSELAPLYSEVVLAPVASNHGQNRQNGKAYTTHDDDSDLTLFESLYERLQENPDAYGHVHLHESADPLVSTLDVGGTGVAFIHAHQVKGVSKPIYSVWSWWDQQIAGRLPAGDCSVLLAAHYHHHYKLVQQGRTLLGCPALDGGSRWLTNSSGIWSDPGVLTLTLDEGDPSPRDVGLL